MFSFSTNFPVSVSIVFSFIIFSFSLVSVYINFLSLAFHFSVLVKASIAIL